MVRELNHTFITLVSKIAGVPSMDESQSISCVNTLYKIHAKIIGSRMGEVVPNLLLGNQVAFIVGRLIGEKFKLAKEMNDKFGCKSTPRWFCMLIDFCKAFDTLAWSAIDNTLTRMGFLEGFQWILYQRYMTPSFSVLCDRDLMTIITNQRELQLGDPISPI